MIYDVFLEGVSYLIHEIYMDIGVTGVHLATTFIDGEEYGLDA
jgi:hypothetical protein